VARIHHHATLCIAAYGFLVAEREAIPPRDLVPPRCSRNLPYPTVTDPKDPPLWPERHIPNSIATKGRAASLSRMGRFETQWLAASEPLYSSGGALY